MLKKTSLIVFILLTKFYLAGAVRKFGRNQAMVPQTKVARSSITIKDVIAVLEREPQMSRSTLLYRLYEKVKSDPTPD